MRVDAKHIDQLNSRQNATKFIYTTTIQQPTLVPYKLRTFRRNATKIVYTQNINTSGQYQNHSKKEINNS